MPEMPEVEIIRRYLNQQLTGRRIMNLEILLPRQIKWPTQKGTGRWLSGVRYRLCDRGKYLLMEQ